jgi:hypothetical protein
MRWNKDSFAHKMVAHTQVEMAGAIYEELAGRDDFYKEWPDRNAFIKVCAPTLRDAARQCLSEQLARHDVSEFDKEAIYEALLLDAVIPNEDRFHVPAIPLIH